MLMQELLELRTFMPKKLNMNNLCKCKNCENCDIYAQEVKYEQFMLMQEL